jgi:hypothetical protein
VDRVELLLLSLLDEEFTRHPFYGSRKMVVWLGIQGSREPEARAAADADIRLGGDGAWP